VLIIGFEPDLGILVFYVSFSMEPRVPVCAVVKDMPQGLGRWLAVGTIQTATGRKETHKGVLCRRGRLGGQGR